MKTPSTIGIAPKRTFRKFAAAIAIAASLGSSASAFAGDYSNYPWKCDPIRCELINFPAICKYAICL